MDYIPSSSRRREDNPASQLMARVASTADFQHGVVLPRVGRGSPGGLNRIVGGRFGGQPKGHHRRFGWGCSSGSMGRAGPAGRAFGIVLNCSINSW